LIVTSTWFTARNWPKSMETWDSSTSSLIFPVQPGPRH
jgi:hypothetical protein